MKQNYCVKTVLLLTVLFLVSGGVNTPTALAGRYIFNQTPETLEKAFGSPVETAECVPEPNRTPDSPQQQWCCFRFEGNQGISRCVQSEKGQPLPIMHLYAPASFEKAFPDFPGSLFKISYIIDTPHE